MSFIIHHFFIISLVDFLSELQTQFTDNSAIWDIICYY